MFRPCSPDHMLYKTGRFGVLSLSYCCKKVKVNTKSKWLQDSMIFSKFLEKMHPLRGGSLPPSRWSLSSAALSPSLLISPPLALDSTCLWCRVPELPPDLLGRRGRRVSSSLVVHGCIAIGAGRLHPRSKKTWESNCVMMMKNCMHGTVQYPYLTHLINFTITTKLHLYGLIVKIKIILAKFPSLVKNFPV